MSASSLSGIKKGPDETLSIPSFHVDNSAMVNRVINAKISQVKEYLNTELTNVNLTLNKYIKETKTETDAIRNNTDRVNSINVKVNSLEERIESRFNKITSLVNSLVDKFENLNNSYQQKVRNEKEEHDRIAKMQEEQGKIAKMQEEQMLALNTQSQLNELMTNRLNSIELQLNQINYKTYSTTIESRLSEAYSAYDEIKKLQTRIVEANEPILRRIIDLEEKFTQMNEQPYPFTTEEPPQFLVMPHQSIRRDDDSIRSELFKFAQILQGNMQQYSEESGEVVEIKPVEEVVEIKPVEEVIDIKPVEEVVEIKPVEEVIDIKPVEEVEKKEPSKELCIEPVNKLEEIGVNEIIINDSSIPLNLPIKLMKNKKPKRK